MATLSELIANSIGVAQEQEASAPLVLAGTEDGGAPDIIDFDDAEKLASALEYLGQQGVGNLLKEAAVSPARGTETPSGSGQDVGSQGTPGPKVQDGTGTDEKKRPGGNATQPDNKPPAVSAALISSNAKAGNVPGNIGVKAGAPDLKTKLEATPNANPAAKQALGKDVAAKGDDPDSATKLASIRAELARRAAQGGK